MEKQESLPSSLIVDLLLQVESGPFSKVPFYCYLQSPPKFTKIMSLGLTTNPL